MLVLLAFMLASTVWTKKFKIVNSVTATKLCYQARVFNNRIDRNGIDKQYYSKEKKMKKGCNLCFASTGL